MGGLSRNPLRVKKPLANTERERGACQKVPWVVLGGAEPDLSGG